jgi:WXG100 protein secretion system (Wss), protein YukD
MTALLVTVTGPRGRRDLVVPADVPVGDLLAALAAALAAPPGAEPPGAAVALVAGGQLPGATPLAGWRIGAVGGEPLPAERSLAACGVGDGAVLELTRDAAAAAALARGPRRCPVVGVVSAVAGVGRTTVAALLASTLAAAREGLTVAVDTRPGPGSLSEPLDGGRGVPAADLLVLLDHPALTGEELAACLAGRRPGAAVVAAGTARGSRGPASPVTPGVHGHGDARLGPRALARLVAGLAEHASALVLDCGPGLGDPGARVAVAAAGQLVLVTEPQPSPATRRLAGALLDLGHAVVAVAASPAPAGTGPRRRSGAAGLRRRGGWPGGARGQGGGRDGAAALGRLLPGVRGVVVLPPHPVGGIAAAAATAPRRWEELPPWWRGAGRQLAALLAADWHALGIATGDSKPAGQAAQTACRSRN